MATDDLDGLRRDAQRLRHVAIVASGHTDATAAMLVRAIAGNGAEPLYADAHDGMATTGVAVTPVVFPDRDNKSGSRASYQINLITAHPSERSDAVAQLDVALALCDGVLLVVDDDSDGLSLLVEMAVQRAVVDGKTIVLLIHMLRTGRMEVEDMSRFVELDKIITAINAVIYSAAASDDEFETRRVSPARGTVAFGSVCDDWALILPHSGVSDESSFDVGETELAAQRWRDWFVDAVGRQQWTSDNDARLTDEHARRSDAACISLPIAQHGQWLPLRLCMLNMVVQHVPSPIHAQQTLVLPDRLPWAEDVRHCRPHGALVAHVVQLCPSRERHDRCDAVVRVLSGQLSTGQAVRVVTHTQPDGKLHERRVPWRRPNEWDSNPVRVEAVGVLAETIISNVHADVVLAGHVGIVSGITTTGILTTCEASELVASAWIRQLVAPSSATPMVVRVTIEPGLPDDLSALVAAVARLGQLNPSVACYTEASGELTFAASTSESLQCGLRRLHEILLNHNGRAIDVVVSTPSPCYRETVTMRSPAVLQAMSPNKNVRVRCDAEPLDDALAHDLAKSSGRSWVRQATRLHSTFGWSESAVRQILNGDHTSRATSNLLIHASTARQVRFNLLEEGILTGLSVATHLGALCDEPLFGVRVNFHEVWLWGMERHWSRGQTIVATRRVVAACQLASSPALLEPVMAVEIRTGANLTTLCVDVMTARGARVVDAKDHRTRFLIAAGRTHNLEEALCAAVGETATADSIQLLTVFDHYERVEGDPLDPESVAGRIVRELRTRKQLDD